MRNLKKKFKKKSTQEREEEELLRSPTRKHSGLEKVWIIALICAHKHAETLTLRRRGTWL